FPNRLPFSEFRQRYEVLCREMPKGYLDGQAVAQIMLEKLGLDKTWYRVGRTKVFFRAGVLAELEEQRDELIRSIMGRFQSLARGFIQRRISNKRLYRAEATRIIQHNFHRRDERIQLLEGKAQQDVADRHKVEEERRRTEIEMQKIQQVLESERALALDKEEIFKRLQVREVELSEKLAGAIADQENLEDQLDGLIDAKKRADDQLELRITQLEQAGEIIERFEAEKDEVQRHLQNLDQRLVGSEQTLSEKERQLQELSQGAEMLQSQMSLKDRKLHDLEAKLLKTDQDLDIKFANATRELDQSKKHVKQLTDENWSIRQQISDLSSTSTGYEEMLRRKESEMAILKNDVKKHEEEKRHMLNEKSSLSTRHDNMQKRLREVQAEADAMISERHQLEKEAQDVKKLLEEKLSEDAEAGESRKLLEQQTQDLK
ncbi:class II myosin, partial [Elasticomyces elasticus]